MKFFQTMLLGAVFALSACIGAGDISDVNRASKDVFPSMQGIDLLGNERAIPDSFQGELNIVVVAFEREQQEEVNTWIAVAEDIMPAHAGLRFYEIPLIYELNALYRTWINNGMRAGIPSKASRERTITVYTERPKVMEMMNWKADTIYAYLIDQKGRILWRENGVATEETAKALEKKIRELTQGEQK